MLIKDVDTDSNGDPRVMGTKMSKIRERAINWNNISDEILELKKIFYEFIKSIVTPRKNSADNRMIIYERHDEDEHYTLDSLLGVGGQSFIAIEKEEM